MAHTRPEVANLPISGPNHRRSSSPQRSGVTESGSPSRPVRAPAGATGAPSPAEPASCFSASCLLILGMPNPAIVCFCLVFPNRDKSGQLSIKSNPHTPTHLDNGLVGARQSVCAAALNRSLVPPCRATPQQGATGDRVKRVAASLRREPAHGQHIHFGENVDNIAVAWSTRLPASKKKIIAGGVMEIQPPGKGLHKHFSSPSCMRRKKVIMPHQPGPESSNKHGWMHQVQTSNYQMQRPNRNCEPTAWQAMLGCGFAVPDGCFQNIGRSILAAALAAKR